MYSGEYDVCDVTLSVYPHRQVFDSNGNDGKCSTVMVMTIFFLLPTP
jgi:hypothetical protein